MQEQETQEVLIPFSGFCETQHSETLDWVAEFMFSDDSGNVYGSLFELCWSELQWGKAREAYARDYADAFLKYVGLPGEFSELVSPREYNFGTDRIFATVPMDKLHALTVPAADMDRVCKAWFTSRSGFISHYSPDWREWGEMADWDHNQHGARLVAYMEAQDMDPDDVGREIGQALGEDSISYENLLIGDEPSVNVSRALKIHGYLRDREDRKWAARKVASMSR